jgi:spore germination protein PC
LIPSNNPNYANVNSYMQQIHQYMSQWTAEHQRQVKELETRIRLLQEEHKSLKEQLGNIKQVHIENINYKIQELTVKELKGTLNIGMTALTDPEEIKKWLGESDGDVQMGDMSSPQPGPGILPNEA